MPGRALLFVVFDIVHSMRSEHLFIILWLQLLHKLSEWLVLLLGLIVVHLLFLGDVFRIWLVQTLRCGQISERHDLLFLSSRAVLFVVFDIVHKLRSKHLFVLLRLQLLH